MDAKQYSVPFVGNAKALQRWLKQQPNDGSTYIMLRQLDTAKSTADNAVLCQRVQEYYSGSAAEPTTPPSGPCFSFVYRMHLVTLVGTGLPPGLFKVEIDKKEISEYFKGASDDNRDFHTFEIEDHSFRYPGIQDEMEDLAMALLRSNRIGQEG